MIRGYCDSTLVINNAHFWLMKNNRATEKLWNGMLWHGMECYGMECGWVWYGTLWYGMWLVMAWYGMTL